MPEFGVATTLAPRRFTGVREASPSTVYGAGLLIPLRGFPSRGFESLSLRPAPSAVADREDDRGPDHRDRQRRQATGAVGEEQEHCDQLYPHLGSNGIAMTVRLSVGEVQHPYVVRHLGALDLVLHRHAEVLSDAA